MEFVPEEFLPMTFDTREDDTQECVPEEFFPEEFLPVTFDTQEGDTREEDTQRIFSRGISSHDF